MPRRRAAAVPLPRLLQVRQARRPRLVRQRRAARVASRTGGRSSRRPGGGRASGARGGGGGGRGRAGMPEGYTNPYTPGVFEFKANDWNALEAQVDANVLRGWLNNGPESGAANGAADEERGSYGPIALYVGGSGEVRFKDIAVKDLGRHVLPAEAVSPRYKMLRLSNFNYTWSTAVADINRDGHPDIVAGPWYFLGPDFTVSREIALSQTWNPSNAYPNNLWVQHAFDWTGDGWPDVLMGTTLFVNPGKELRRWTRMPTGMLGGGEVTAFADVDGDGKTDVINSSGAGVSFSHPDPAKPLGPWVSVNVSGPGPWGAHGVGAGDINGDGKLDIVNPYGWWEQPAGGGVTDAVEVPRREAGRLGPRRRRARRRGDDGVRRQRRRQERHRDQPAGARVGVGLVRAEARCGG